MRFSKFLFPIQVLTDLLILAVLLRFTLYYFSYDVFPGILAITFVAWFISMYLEGSYKLRRYSRIPKTLRNLTRLGVIFFGMNFMLQEMVLKVAYSSMFYFVYHSGFVIILMISRVVAIRLIKKYRSLGRNYRNVLILGDTPDTKNLKGNFKEGNDLGYRLQGVMIQNEYSLPHLINFVKSHLVDEIFISASEFTSSTFNEIIDFAENNLIKIRVVPNFSGVFASNLKLDYVGYQPVLVYRDVALDDMVNASVKRLFDVIFSLLVIVLVLSWLIPIMALIIRLESKGPVLFRQKRSGINNGVFDCFKFRSMAVNEDSNSVQATKGDMRITKVGAFIRKTSIDELPQFLNVLLGDMSVVGPRPHMVKHTEEFSNEVDRYMLRHSVKPGITGLAQIMGYRGETKTRQDIKGRVTLDRFYIENWNFFLDLKIINKTLLNGVKGDEKAY